MILLCIVLKFIWLKYVFKDLWEVYYKLFSILDKVVMEYKSFDYFDKCWIKKFCLVWVGRGCDWCFCSVRIGVVLGRNIIIVVRVD